MIFSHTLQSKDSGSVMSSQTGTIRNYQLPTYAHAGSLASVEHETKYFFGPGHGGVNPAVTTSRSKVIYHFS